MQLAQAREASHPAQAAEIYRPRVQSMISMTTNAGYDQAAKLIAHIRGLMKRAGQQHEFDEWLSALRVRHKAKRNFLKRLAGLVSLRGTAAK